MCRDAPAAVAGPAVLTAHSPPPFVALQVVNVFKTGDVQRRRRDTYKEGGVAYPRVHGLVYAPGDGVLRQLPVDFKEVLRQNKRVYDLYQEEDK